MLNKNRPFFKKTLKNFVANTVFSFIAQVTLQQKKRQEISRNSMLNEIVVAAEMSKSTKNTETRHTNFFGLNLHFRT